MARRLALLLAAPVALYACQPPPAPLAPPTSVGSAAASEVPSASPSASSSAVAATPEARADALVAAMTQEEKLAYLGGDRDFFIRPVPRLKIPEIKLADGPAGCRNWGPSTAYPSAVGLAASFDPALAERMGHALGRDCRARGVHILLAPGVNLQRSPLNGRNFEYVGEDPWLASRTAVGVIRGVQAEGVLATVKHFALNEQEWDRNFVSSEADQRTLRELYLQPFEAAVKEAKVGAVMTSYNLVNGTWATHHPWLTRELLRGEWAFGGFVMSDWMAAHEPLGTATGGCDLEMPRAEQQSPKHLTELLAAGKITQALIDEKVRNILRTLARAGFLDRVQQRKDVPLDDPSSSAVALEVARSSAVLVKNERAALPLDKGKLKRVLVVGPNGTPAVVGGSGSAFVTPFHTVSLVDGLRAAGVEVVAHPGLQERTAYAALATAEGILGPLKQEIFRGKLEGAPVDTRTVDRIDFDPKDGEAPAAGVGAEHYSVRWTGTLNAPKAGLYQLMTNADDGIRVFVDGKLALDDWRDHGPTTRLEKLKLAAGKHALVVEYYQGILGAVAQFGFGAVVDTTKLEGEASLRAAMKDADAIVVAFGYGQNGATNSLSRRFDGFWPPGWARETSLVEAEESDRSFTLPRAQLETLKLVGGAKQPKVGVLFAGGGVELSFLPQLDALLWAFYPGQEGGTALAELLLGVRSPSGKMPFTLAKRFEDHPSSAHYLAPKGYKVGQGTKTHYAEGVLMGYRGFDAANVEPAFPFGHGLSYTTFALTEPSAQPSANGAASVTVTVANTGAVAGAEVVQVYAAPPPGAAGQAVKRAPRTLAAFARVQLAPGERRTVTFPIPARAFARWDGEWLIDGGRWELRVGTSSRDARLAVPLEQAARKLGR